MTKYSLITCKVTSLFGDWLKLIIIHYMRPILKYTRTASLSSIGKHYDKLYGESASVHKSLRRVQSIQSIPSLPTIPSKQTQKLVGTSHNKNRLSPGAKQRNQQIKKHIIKEIDQIKNNMRKGKKLVLGNRKQQRPSEHKQQNINRRHSIKQQQTHQIQSWKDLKNAAPKVGYQYIQCKNQPLSQNPSRKVTISKKWVMITEPNQQSIYGINQYSEILRKYEGLAKVDLFKDFLLAKSFRKWRMVAEFSQLRHKKSLIEQQLKSVYRPVYLNLAQMLEQIRKCKFVGASVGNTFTFQDYHQYLYKCSLPLLQYIHNYVFVGCVQVIFRPIRQLAIVLKQKEEDRKKEAPDHRPEHEFIANYMMRQGLDRFSVGRQEKIRQTSLNKKYKSFELLKSIEFRTSFMQYFRVLKRCIYMFNEAYVDWANGILTELVTKLEGSLVFWEREKQRFSSILNIIVSQNTEKYTYYSPDYADKDIESVTYKCEIDDSRHIGFQASQEYLVSIFKQYTDYLMKNLSLQKLIECYARQHEESQPVELQLLVEILKTNDFYNIFEIQQRFSFKAEFDERVTDAISTNFSQVYSIIEFYNILMRDFFDNMESNRITKNPSDVYEYLECIKVKLIYLPRSVNVGLITLDFLEVHQYLELQVGYMQKEIYVNVPKDFRSLFTTVCQTMDGAYLGVRNSMWTVDQLLSSYGHYESYQQYRISKLHESIEKFKSYLEVISAKCPQYYNECFLMFVHIKEMRDKLEIKNQIFTQRLPGRLKSFKGEIEKVREEIWRDLFAEQTKAIATCKEEFDIITKFQHLKECAERLKGIRLQMDKLQTIGKLQTEYFIEQELGINTHSYLKMSSDLGLLLSFTRKLIEFSERVRSLFPKSITEVHIDQLLGKLRSNIAEIKEVYLLLIAYQTLLREVLDKYQEWRKYLQTAGEISFLTVQEIASIRKLKELNFRNRGKCTLEECYRLNIQTIYNEIHDIKEKKLKAAQLNSLFLDLESLQKHIPFQISRKRRNDSSKNIKTRSKGSADQARGAQRYANSFKYQFQIFDNIYKSLQLFQNQLRLLSGSPYLSDFKLNIDCRSDHLQHALDMFKIVADARDQYNTIMEVDLEEEFADKGEECKWVLIEELHIFFQNSNRQKQEIRDCWYRTVTSISKKSLAELLIAFEQVENSFKILGLKMRSLREGVIGLVRKKRQQIPMLNLVEDSTVLAVVQCPAYYFQLFYPVRELRKPESSIQVVTVCDQILNLNKAENQKDALIDITGLQLKITHELRRLLATHQDQHPIDNLLNYMDLQLPLQIIYALDQLYFASKYLTLDKNSSQIIRSLEGQIKLICRNGLKQEFDAAKVNYSLALFDQLLAARIELRTRVEHNPSNEIWYRNILVFQLYENMLTLRNFNTQILSSFHLIDHSALTLSFPHCEKALVKVCNAMKFHESIVIGQTEIVSSIAARTMSLSYKIQINESNIQNVLYACQQLYPLFIVGLVGNLEKSLFEIFEELNKIERANTLDNNLPKERRLLPSIFVHSINHHLTQLNETLKLRFRIISIVSPCPQIFLSTKMLSYDHLIEKPLFLNIVYVLRSYVILLRERKQHTVTFQDMANLCDHVVKYMLSFKGVDCTDSEVIIQLFNYYFQAIDYSLEQFLLNYTENTLRIQYQRSQIYDLASNIILNTVKELPLLEDTGILYRIKEYETMKKSFAKFTEVLITQKYDTDFVERLSCLFEFCFNLENRPIAVIGPHQSGKTQLFKLMHQYLTEILGSGQLSWRNCNLAIFNAVLGVNITENEPLIKQFVNQTEDKEISWIVFEGFAFEDNSSLLEHIFNGYRQQVRMKGLHLGNSTALSFCQLYHCRQHYIELLRGLHNKYISFELINLNGVTPAYIYALNKVYLPETSQSLASLYTLRVNDFLKEIIDRKDEFYQRVNQDFALLLNYMLTLLDELMVRKAKSFEWIIVLTQKCALWRCLDYFFSFFYRDGRQKIEIIFNCQEHYYQLCKLATYALYSTFEQFVDRNFVALLQKVVKGIYYGLSHEQSRDNFLTKLCYFSGKELEYVQYEKLRVIQGKLEKVHLSQDIIVTPEIQIAYRKYLLQLVEAQVPIIVTGAKQSGKTTLIRLFMNRYYNGQIIIKGTGVEAIKELIKSVSTVSWAPDCGSQCLVKKIDYVIYVEDVSLQPELSNLQRYLQYIMANGLIDSSQIKVAPFINTIMQRRVQPKQMLWRSYTFSFQNSKEYFQCVFSILICDKVELHFRNRGKKGLTTSSFQRLAEKYLKLIRFCNENFRRGLKSWTYDFGIVTLKSILINFINRFSYEEIGSQEEMVCKMSIEVMARVKERLQELREAEKMEDRITCIFDSSELQAIEEYCQRENLIIAYNLDEQGEAEIVRRLILTEDVKGYSSKLVTALRCTDCVLISKVNVPFNHSLAQTLINILKLPILQLLHCQNNEKFLSQIQKAAEMTLKKNSISYYYLSLEEVIDNPQVLLFIADYLRRTQAQSQAKTASHHQCKFIIEYSTEHHHSISYFLKSGLLPISYVLHFLSRNVDQYEQITRILLEEQNKQGQNYSQMEEAVKIVLRIFVDMQSFECPQHIKIYLFSEQNLAYLIMQLLESYGRLVKRSQTKHIVLELSLSQLNYMFKEYKERKIVFKQLQAEQANLLSSIGIAKDDYHKRNLEYNSIKNQNLKQVIQHNEIEIQRLERERDQLLSSEKIWSNIYRNAHAAISRTEFAEIKYMFMTNYAIERELFEAIAFVLQEDTDLLSLKKCFSDINVMAKIKDTKIPELPFEILKELETRLESMACRDRLSCGRNIVQWMKVGCRLGLYRQQRGLNLEDLDSNIARLETENRQIRQKNRMDLMEKELTDLQRKIAQKSADLNIVHLKITSIGSELQEVKKEFEELIEFEVYCLAELQTLRQNSKKLLNFCLAQTLHFSFAGVLTGNLKRKFREIINSKLRKIFGNLVTREESEYFDLLREQAEDKTEQNWLVKPKQYLSFSTKRLIEEINSFLINYRLPIAIVDPRCVFLQDTLKKNFYYLRMSDITAPFCSQRNLQQYSMLVIELGSWAFSLKFIDAQHKARIKYRVLKHAGQRLLLPSNIPIVLIFTKVGDKQAMLNFKVVDLEYCSEDYYDIVWNIVTSKRGKCLSEGMFSKLLKVEHLFMEIVYFLCKKTQNINLRSKGLIRTLTKMIQTFNRQKSGTRSIFLGPAQETLSIGDLKLCRVLSKILQMMVTYFPSQEHTSCFFRDLLSTSFDYMEMEGIRDNQSIIYLVIELLTEGFKDKFPFIYLYYVSIFVIEEGQVTIMESHNLLALADPKQLVADALKDTDKNQANLFKHLPYKNSELEKIYLRLHKLNCKSQSDLVRLIDSERISLFNRLILKRILVPKAFEVEIGRIIRDFQDRTTLKNKMFLRRYVVKQCLFCVCDASFWISKLKFTNEFKLVLLSEINHINPRQTGNETWAVFDDMKQCDQKTVRLRELIRLNYERVSTVLFSCQFLRQQFRESFKFLPFQHLLNIFQIKELTKVSKNKYSHIFNKIIYFKSEMLRRKPFNQRISFSFLFEKIREQIMNKEDYSVDEIILHFEWDFFLWDSTFESNHHSLAYILTALDANPHLINEFVADDKLQDRINIVITRAHFTQCDSHEVCTLAGQLRDSATHLEVKSRDETDIYYLEFDYKREKLVQQMEIIKHIAEIQLGKVEISSELAVKLKQLLSIFNYAQFSGVLTRLINWRRLEFSHRILNVGLMESHFNLYLQFQNSVHLYYEMPQLDIESVEKNAQEEQPLSSNSNFSRELSSEAINRNRVGLRRSLEKDASAIRKSIEKDNSILKRRNTKSISMMKRLMGKRKVSITANDAVPVAGEETCPGDEIAQEYFRNSLFIIDSRIVGLKKLGVKEQKNFSALLPRSLDLPCGFNLRVIELGDLLQNGAISKSLDNNIPKCEVINRESRFNNKT